MESHARVVVIGGGVTGCAILYHLAKMGWRDVVLLERQELTSGSSWHAAGSLFALTSPSNAAILQKYTIGLYPQLEAESGQSCGYHPVGGMHLARTEDQYMALKLLHSRGKRNGIEIRIHLGGGGPAHRARSSTPTGIKAVLHEPIKGYCDPASVTQAYAKAARDLGAKIHRFTPVTATRPLPDGSWEVETPEGTIRADYHRQCRGTLGAGGGGAGGHRSAADAGRASLHGDGDHSRDRCLRRRDPNISEPSGGYYCRQEGKGLLLGAYEIDLRALVGRRHAEGFRP